MHDHMEPYSEDIKPGLRAGNAQRQAALDHVERMIVSGHLDGEEGGKRARTITNAKTEREIALALSDLPKARSLFSPKWFHWDKPAHYIPVLLFTAMLSVAFAAFPFILGNIMGWYHSDLMAAAGVPSIIIGVLGFVSSIIALVAKLDS